MLTIRKDIDLIRVARFCRIGFQSSHACLVLDCCVRVKPEISHRLRLEIGVTTGLLAMALCAFAQSTTPQLPPGLPQAPSPRTHVGADPSLGEAGRGITMTGQVSVLHDDVPWALNAG